jgi:hypothetical protein
VNRFRGSQVQGNDLKSVKTPAPELKCTENRIQI